MVTNMTNYYASAPDETFEVVPTVVTVDGGKDHITLATRSQDAISITTACQSVEAALGWINYWFTDEGIMLYNYGVEGDTYVMENGTPQYTEKVMNNELGVDPTLFCRTFSLAAGLRRRLAPWLGQGIRRGPEKQIQPRLAVDVKNG